MPSVIHLRDVVSNTTNSFVVRSQEDVNRVYRMFYNILREKFGIEPKIVLA